MAFTVDIGYTTDNINKVNKSVTYIQQGVTIHPLSVLQQHAPVFVIDFDSRFLSANYVVAGFLGRKYFCSVSVDTAQTMALSCTVDVLSSFDLSGCPIQVTRCGGLGAPTDYPDSKFPIIPNRKDITSTVRANPELDVNNGVYILTVIGGGT